MIYFILAFIGIASAGLLGPMADVPPADAVPLVSFLNKIMVSIIQPGPPGTESVHPFAVHLRLSL